MAPLFLKLIFLKAFHNQLKSLSNLTCSQIFWLFDFFLFRLILAESTAEYNRKEVTFWF